MGPIRGPRAAGGAGGLMEDQVPWALCRGWGPGTHLGGRVGGPGTHFGGRIGGPGTHLGGALAPEAEGRHYGGRRPTKWGSGGGAPRNNKKVKKYARTLPRSLSAGRALKGFLDHAIAFLGGALP